MRVEDSLIATACAALLLALLFARPDSPPSETVAGCMRQDAPETPMTRVPERCEHLPREKRHAAR